MPFRGTRPAGTADDDVRSNANMPVAGTPVLAARSHRSSIFGLLMMEKRIVIHEPDRNVVALAWKLLIALWRHVTTGEKPAGATLHPETAL
jgi:hypothetical protein